ncbi:hypothetical protein VNO80_29882 [Phaseolus coccineus]|uniref:Non-specific lipid-transfer protein n=1 Tax=Phaseolus coccineus TaxID=3886 RepID=A0AAN9LC65_PHACN
MAVTKVALVATMIACMLITCSYSKSTLTCDQITIWLTPCIAYAVLGGNVSSLCCQGIYSLEAAKKSGEDRRGACQCIKDRAAYIPGIDYDRVNEIPEKCGTKCSYKVYPSTNCSAVQVELPLECVSKKKELGSPNDGYVLVDPTG